MNTRSRSTGCRSIRRSLDLYHDRGLTGALSGRIVAHVAVCSSCAAELRRIELEEEKIRSIAPAPTALSPRETRLLLDRALAEARVARTGSRPSIFGWTIASASLALAIGMGCSAWVGRRAEVPTVLATSTTTAHRPVKRAGPIVVAAPSFPLAGTTTYHQPAPRPRPRRRLRRPVLPGTLLLASARIPAVRSEAPVLPQVSANSGPVAPRPNLAASQFLLVVATSVAPKEPGGDSPGYARVAVVHPSVYGSDTWTQCTVDGNKTPELVLVNASRPEETP